MRDEDVGCLLVLDGERRPIGTMTDRDLVTRVIARDRNPASTRLGTS